MRCRRHVGLCTVLPPAGVDAAQTLREPLGRPSYRLVLYQGHCRSGSRGDCRSMAARTRGTSAGRGTHPFRRAYELVAIRRRVRRYRHCGDCGLCGRLVGYAHRGTGHDVVVAQGTGRLPTVWQCGECQWRSACRRHCRRIRGFHRHYRNRRQSGHLRRAGRTRRSR